MSNAAFFSDHTRGLHSGGECIIEKEWLHWHFFFFFLHGQVRASRIYFTAECSESNERLIHLLFHSLWLKICAVFDLNINAIQRNEAVDDADRPRERGKRQKAWERERGENRLLVGCDKLFLKPWRTRWAAVRKNKGSNLSGKCSTRSRMFPPEPIKATWSN